MFIRMTQYHTLQLQSVISAHTLCWDVRSHTIFLARCHMPSTKPLPIIDLHCDLLAYMSSIDSADAFSDEINCSIPALLEGNIVLQTLALYSATNDNSVSSATDQAHYFSDLMEEFPDYVVPFDEMTSHHDILTDGRIVCIAAIENASGFCDEEQDLDEAWEQLEDIQDHTGSLLYISMTHDHENRFGGGNMSDIGLKPDGEELLMYMNGERIAIDLAHTSDALAMDILDYIDRYNLDIPIMASHSNMRSICNVPRNLPDEYIKEIIDRGGVIGINFFREFISEDNPLVLVDHVLHCLDLGGENALCFGSDFFYSPEGDDFFEEFSDSSSVQTLVRALRPHVSAATLRKFCYGNALDFMRRVGR
jgi:membrane dipeptidase